MSLVIDAYTIKVEFCGQSKPIKRTLLLRAMWTPLKIDFTVSSWQIRIQHRSSVEPLLRASQEHFSCDNFTLAKVYCNPLQSRHHGSSISSNQQTDSRVTECLVRTAETTTTQIATGCVLMWAALRLASAGEYR